MKIQFFRQVCAAHTDRHTHIVSMFNNFMVFSAHSLAISDEDKNAEDKKMEEEEEAKKKALEENLYLEKMAHF